MTVETRLRAAMADAVAPTAPDADHLVAVARRRGLGIRRRRQALGGVGVAAALGLAVLAPSVVAGDHGSQPTPTASVTVGTSPVTFDSEGTRKLTGRSTAAALLYAVGLKAKGTAADFHGQGFAGDVPQSYGRFAFTPAGSTTAGEVGVNVQPQPTIPQKGEPAERNRCDSFMEKCRISHLADGSVLVTYEVRSDYGSRAGIRRVADLRRTDQVRVVASASNGYDVTERDEKITRAAPVLTTDQLVAVVTQPWWGARLPAYFTDQGRLLADYNAIEGAAATPTAAPRSSTPTPAPTSTSSKP